MDAAHRTGAEGCDDQLAWGEKTAGIQLIRGLLDFRLCCQLLKIGLILGGKQSLM
jgi:hypothetical protein